MPAYSVAEGPRFDGEFGLAADTGHAPTGDETAYTAALQRAMDAFERDRGYDPTGTDENSRALTQARGARRRAALAEMRTQADEFIAGTLNAALARDNVFTIRGKYVADLERLDQSLFVVELKVEGGQVTDLLMAVSEDLPLTSDPAAQDKRALYVAIDNARTVVKTVARRIQERAERFGRRNAAKERELRRAARLRSEYLQKLADIARNGLQHSHVDLAKLALEGFRSEFVIQEAGRIKNTYLRTLGAAAGTGAVFFFVILVARSYLHAESIWNYREGFLLAAAGSAIGTWISFSIRRVNLGFDDLGILEEDLLDPSLRVIFVFLLTTVVWLLFSTGAVNLEIGNLKTAELSNPHSTLPIGSIALLVGIFCGISERALATAISGRATAFVKSLGA